MATRTSEWTVLIGCLVVSAILGGMALVMLAHVSVA